MAVSEMIWVSIGERGASVARNPSADDELVLMEPIERYGRLTGLRVSVIMKPSAEEGGGAVVEPSLWTLLTEELERAPSTLTGDVSGGV